MESKQYMVRMSRQHAYQPEPKFRGYTGIYMRHLEYLFMACCAKTLKIK